MLSVAAVCAVISLTIGYTSWGSDPGNSGAWGRNLLRGMLWIQILTLTVGGALACMQSVSREKELNTFDFQRLTRLTPLELALGKILGAPILAYFIAACFLPALLWGAILSGTRPSFLLAAMIIVLLGSFTFHALSLTISMLLARGLSIGGALILIYLLSVGSYPGFGDISVGRLSPFFAVDLVGLTSWSEATNDGARLIDNFFGVHVHHFLMLVLLNLAFAAWLFLGLARNLKRDPSAYELFSARQSFAFALFINFLFVGFYRWEGKSPLESQGLLLVLNALLYFGLGLALLNNRDQVRRRARSLGASAAGWLAALWPAPYIVTGLATVGLLGSLLYASNPVKGEWSWSLALFRVAFVAVWISRDVIYLQWANLTRIKRPLVMGFIFLLVYYACMGMLIAAASPAPGKGWLAAIFLPGGALGLDFKQWTAHAPGWMATLLIQMFFCGIFVFLQRLKLQEIGFPETPDAPSTAPSLPGQPSLS